MKITCFNCGKNLFQGTTLEPGFRTGADGSQDTYGIPVEAVTPYMVRRFAKSIIGEQP